MDRCPRLSVGLPVHNGAEYLVQALDSLLGQTFEDFELIISDNASTDATADICRRYAAADARVRYIRQYRNIGAAPNHNFAFQQARGELFKWAAHDDLYGPDLLLRCVEALDEHPQAVLAHAWLATIDGTGAVIETYDYRLATDSPLPAERFRSLLFALGGDDIYGVVRADVLRRVAPHGSYHHADRTIVAEIALHGPFHQVPELLYLRRDHPDRAERAHPTKRSRSGNMDPRRTDRLRHPTVRLLAEYVWGYVAGIRRAPLTATERRQCLRHLTRWLASRTLSRRFDPLANQQRRQRVGLFGLLGSGNFGNDGCLDAVLGYLRAEHPDAVLEARCSGPETVTRRYGVPATRLHWSDTRAASGTSPLALKATGKFLDAFRTLSWVRRQDVVIVPGMGVLEATLPQRPWGFPYALFLLCASGRLAGTTVALVGVGADVVRAPATRWMITAAARLAHYRSYRDTLSRDAMQSMGVDTTADEVYPDLAFALPSPPPGRGVGGTVGVGVMAYHGGNDDRRRAADLHADYVAAMKRFVRWLVDEGRRVSLLYGDRVDEEVVKEILADVQAHRPTLAPSDVLVEQPDSLDDVMVQLAAVDTVVATRYHNVLCAVKLCKPTLSIGYAAKNDVLMAEMGLGDFCQSARSVDVAFLIEQFNALELRREQLRHAMTVRNEVNVRRLQDQFAALSATLLQSSPAAPAVGGNGTVS